MWYVPSSVRFVATSCKLLLQALLFTDFNCEEDEHTCSVSGRCLSEELVCDGIPDCIDQSDEIGCGEDPVIFDQFYPLFPTISSLECAGPWL